MIREPLGTWTDGVVRVCGNCDHASFYERLTLDQISGPLKHEDLGYGVLDVPQLCRSCGVRQWDESRSAVRFSCPSCKKTNVSIVEASEVKIVNPGEENECRIHVMSQHEVVCVHCDEAFGKGCILHDNDTSDWWLSRVLWKKVSEESPESTI